MKFDLPEIMARADKVLNLKKNMQKAWPDMEEEWIDRIIFAAGFQDAFREGTKAPRNLTTGSYPNDMMAFAKFYRDYKSSPDVHEAYKAFIDDYDNLIKKYNQDKS